MESTLSNDLIEIEEPLVLGDVCKGRVFRHGDQGHPLVSYKWKGILTTVIIKGYTKEYEKKHGKKKPEEGAFVEYEVTHVIDEFTVFARVLKILYTVKRARRIHYKP